MAVTFATRSKSPGALRLRKAGSAGWSLLELLVAIAIVTTLAGLLLGALSESRRRAKGSVEVSNLHQLSLAGTMYHDQYGEWPLSATVVVSAGLAPSAIVVSPLDDTEHGIANEFARNVQVECPACDTSPSTYRRTFLGPEDFGHVQERFKTDIEPMPGAGWLVSLTPSQPARPSAPSDLWNAPVGRYRRVLLSGEVVTRVHEHLRSPEGNIYAMPFMFADGDEVWRHKMAAH